MLDDGGFDAGAGDDDVRDAVEELAADGDLEGGALFSARGIDVADVGDELLGEGGGGEGEKQSQSGAGPRPAAASQAAPPRGCFAASRNVNVAATHTISFRRLPVQTPSAGVGVTRAASPMGWGSLASGSRPSRSYMVAMRSAG